MLKKIKKALTKAQSNPQAYFEDQFNQYDTEDDTIYVYSDDGENWFIVWDRSVDYEGSWEIAHKKV